MICDICKEGPAVIQLTEIEGSGVRQLHLCEKCAAERGVEPAPVEGFESVAGKGVRGRTGGRQAALGNRGLAESLGIDLGPWSERAETMRAEGWTVMFVAVDGRLKGLVAVADPIKETTREAIEHLHREEIRIVMLTGDSRTTAEAVARQLGIDEVLAEVLPQDKSAVRPSQHVQLDQVDSSVERGLDRRDRVRRSKCAGSAMTDPEERPVSPQEIHGAVGSGYSSNRPPLAANSRIIRSVIHSTGARSSVHGSAAGKAIFMPRASRCWSDRS